MTPDQAALFTNDWPSLVPSYVPEPFASVIPSISVTGSEYRLYWYVGGGAPTYLDVHGYLGSNIPDGSFYDLNNQLFVNASVRGYEAYHDPTPIYDAVYWEEEGASYWVTTQGLPTDVVSFANSFLVASVPASEPTATVAPPVSLVSPETVASGGVATVSVSGGGPEATLVTDGGIFSDTGAGQYPGAGDAAVTWVAPDVTVDTTVTFSLLDVNGAVLASTPTLVTAAEAPVSFALDCAPSIAASEAMPVSVTGAGDVTLDAASGYWPRTSPNTDYDPGTDGVTLAVPLGAGGPATLTWNAPATAQTVTLSASGLSGMVIASCQIEVRAAEATAEPTIPQPVATVEPTILQPTATVVIATAPTDVQPPLPTATVPATSPTNGSGPGDGIAPGDGTDPGVVTTPTVPGTNPGDGIDPGQTDILPSATDSAGDGTDFGGATTPPSRATYPAIPTSAPLPDAPPTSVPPTGVASSRPGQPASATSTAPPAATVPGAGPASSDSAPAPAPAAVSPTPTTRPVATATLARVTATATRTTPTASPPTARPRVSTSTAPPPIATQTPPATTVVNRPTVTPGPPTATITPSPATAAVLPASTSTNPAPALPSPTATQVPPTATVVLPTATQVPPTATVVPPTAAPTSAPPIATATRRPPATATATPVRPGRPAPATTASSPSPDASADSGPRATVPPASPAVTLPTPTAAASPTMEAISQEIGPAGGTVQYPAGAQLEIAGGVFGSMMTVSMTRLPDSALPVSSQVDLIPSTGYDIEITAADGTAVATLPAGVLLRLNVPETQRDDAVVYWIDGDRLNQLGVTNRETGGISAPLAHLSRYVAGVPIDENPELGWLPWAVAIAAALSSLIVVGLLAHHAWRQRQHPLVGRR